MKKAIISIFLLLIFIFTNSCIEHNPIETGSAITDPKGGTGDMISDTITTEKETEEMTEKLPDDITEATDYVTQTWIAVDMNFETEYDYKEKEQLYVIFDAKFTNRVTKTTLTLPGFWYGGSTFTVRFAPTEYGVWDFVTSCETDASLDGKTGTVAANAYKGDLAIYKHGFVVVNGSKHFVYADGTPFFYLGDTHWNLLEEEYDKGGIAAGRTGAKSHFKYIVDKRVEQGFTVYQSEPIGTKADLTDGSLSSADAKAFEQNDLYYQYIAEKGLVHANAEFFFAGSMTKALMDNKEYLEAISRYWVARYSAYPVMWTLAQEIDNDFYRERGDQKIYDYSNNPWVLIAEYLHKYDTYNHPLSGHQESTIYTTVTGRGVTQADADNGGKSAFLSAEVTEKTGHNWWAAQWSPSLNAQIDDRVPKDYYASDKVAISFEGRYCNLWTKNYGARAQSWISMLSGFAGVGYGAADIWLYNGTYNLDEPSNDGLETITVEDKAVRWNKSVDFESAYQLGYMRQFFESFNWWELVPDFNDEKMFKPTLTSRKKAFYTCATIENDLYVVYFYSQNTATGTVQGMDKDSVYEAKWFNPRTNEYSDIGEIKAESDGSWHVPARQEALDFVLLLIKK